MRLRSGRLEFLLFQPQAVANDKLSTIIGSLISWPCIWQREWCVRLPLVRAYEVSKCAGRNVLRAVGCHS